MGLAEVKERFMQKVAVRSPDECWLWVAGRFKSGYGAFSMHNKLWKAHRAAYVLFVGRIPRAALVTHRCDNPPCVNPRHLSLGTPQTNMDDKVSRGRETHVRGHYKLTEQEVLTIKHMIVFGASDKHISSMFGVTPGAI